MIDDELARQWRDVDGTTVLGCERCGRPIGAGEPRPAELNASFGEHADGLRVCADCWQAIERGIEPLEPDDEDELEPIQ